MIAPGSRIVCRDAEWLVRRVDRTPSGGQAIRVIGLSEIVRDVESIFLSEIEKSIEVVDPVETELVGDNSPSYRDSILYIESLLRQTPPTDDRIHIGHQGAMDVVPYQLDPAAEALKQARQRILIADAVGLGKTIESGVLLSELIRRGRGKRILVLALKSMLTQFQKELWARFTIPLVRLDSIGIQRIRNRIPANHNPFYYYDKAIISIDTLKQEAEYRTYLENAWWDIIVIDEAHNVAERGSSSQRAKLARLLSSRSDTLILLSATPHDGRKRSFASLMNMLDPTAIADPENYGPEDIEGLYIRRFKKDIKDQVPQAFPERKIRVFHAKASTAEDRAFEILGELQFSRIDQRRTGSMLFRTTLEKSLFSSPAACLQTIDNRVRRLEDEEIAGTESDIVALQTLRDAVSRIDAESFSKYQRLLSLLRSEPAPWSWIKAETDDRLVIFTERVETLRFLASQLAADLKLKPNQLLTLEGSSMTDIEIQDTVERFGRESDPVRLLVATDIAAEGINLHYQSHRMIHFDIPWSLMIFQQRNGRIDRYGQTEKPLIAYLMTDTEVPRIRGDQRILELLIEKDEQVQENIGDPSEFTGSNNVEEEISQTAKAMESALTVDEYNHQLEERASHIDPLSILLGEANASTTTDAAAHTVDRPTLFSDTFTFVEAALGYVRDRGQVQSTVHKDRSLLTLTAPDDLRRRLRYLPPEVEPASGEFSLTADKGHVQREIARCRKEESAWPSLHLLWDLHPVVEWLEDKVLASFRRHQAPVLHLGTQFPSGEVAFLVSGQIPNLRGQPVIYEWFALHFRNGHFLEPWSLTKFLDETKLGPGRHPNPAIDADHGDLQNLLPLAVKEASAILSGKRREWEDATNLQLQAQLERLETLRTRHLQQLSFDFSDNGGGRGAQLKSQKEREIQKLFDDYLKWVEDVMTTEDNPFIKIVAVVKGGAN